MPKELTHWAIAEKTYRSICAESKIKEVIKKYKNLYLAGAVINDTPPHLFYGKFKKQAFYLGRYTHDHIENSFEPVISVFDSFYGDNFEPALALMLGVITHMHIDSVFHPLISYYSGIEEHERHYKIETYLDLCYKGNRDLIPYELLGKLVKNIEIEKGYFIDILSHFFGKNSVADKKLINKSIFMHSLIQEKVGSRFFRILIKTLRKSKVLNVRDYEAALYPRKNPDRREVFKGVYNYTHPVTGDRFDHSIAELEKMSINQSLALFSLVEKNLHCKNSLITEFSKLKGANLSTGVYGVKESQMKHFNTEDDVMSIIFQKGASKNGC